MTLSLASQITGVLSAAILLCSFGLLVQRRMTGLLRLYAWQGFFLFVNTALVGYATGLSHLYISAALTLILKVIALPYILHVIMDRLKIKKDVENLVNTPTTMLIGIGLVIFSYHLCAPIQALSTLMTRSTLAVALSTVMLGLLMMITRKKALTQIIGFLALENGLFFAATSATYGMPLVVEMGIALDVLIAALVFGVFFFHIRTTFDSLDLHEMEKLKEED